MCGIAGAISFVEDMREDMKIYEKMQKQTAHELRAGTL